MGVIIPRKRNRINKIELTNISFDPETGIKNLLLSRQNSLNESMHKKSRNKLYAFFRNFIPFKKPVNPTIKSFSIQSKKNTDINDTLKNFESALQRKKKLSKSKPKENNKINDFLKETLLVKDENFLSKKRDSLFPSFIKKMNEYKKHRMGLNTDDTNLFKILKSYFKSKKNLKQNFSSYELKKNKATLECLLQQQKESLNYYVDDIDLPKKRLLKDEINSLKTDFDEENKPCVTAFPSKQSLKIPKKLMIPNLAEVSMSNNNQNILNNPKIESALDEFKLIKGMKKSLKITLSPTNKKTLSPSSKKMHPSESIIRPVKFSSSDSEKILGMKWQSILPNNENKMGQEPIQLNREENIHNSSVNTLDPDSPKKLSFHKLVLNKCIIPLRFKKPSLRAEIVSKKTIDLKRRRTCFDDEIYSSMVKNLPRLMSPINEEQNSAYSLKNKTRFQNNVKSSKNESSENSDSENGKDIGMSYINKSIRTEEQCFAMESPSKTRANPARIIKYGNWDMSKLVDNDLLLKRKKSLKVKSFGKLESLDNQQRSNSEENKKNLSSSPIVKRVIRGGKTYNILKKNENLIIRNNKAVQILQTDQELLERMKRKEWFDGLDNLGKIVYKNSSPTMYYFCKDKQEKKDYLDFGQ